tara:strand:- start:140 stop:346 length:207 start_codon:yes stop_codon:yes gene_type:complete
MVSLDNRRISSITGNVADSVGKVHAAIFLRRIDEGKYRRAKVKAKRAALSYHPRRDASILKASYSSSL